MFSLAQKPFSPKEVLATVCKIFKPQANFKNVKLYAEITKKLKPPNMIKPDENETFDSDGEDIEQQALFMGQN